MIPNNLPVVENEESCIFFSIGTYNYAFNSKYVLDIMQLMELEYPESLPDFILGLLDYNGKMTKIIDLRNVLNLENSNYSINSKIIIVKTENDIFGIAIDDVKTIRRINSSLISPPPYEIENSYIEAIFTNKDFSSTIINLNNIEKKINSKDYKQNENKNPANLFLPSDIQSKEVLHRRKIHYATKRKTEETDVIIKSQDTYITFLLNNNTYCIKILHVSGFYKFGNVKMIKVPCTPDFIKGVINVKGRYITVIDLLKFIENKETPITKDTNIIVIEYEDYEIGILADAIGETVDIDENIIKIKTENSNNCLTEFVIGETMYLYFDIKKLFEDEKLYIS